MVSCLKTIGIFAAIAWGLMNQFGRAGEPTFEFKDAIITAIEHGPVIIQVELVYRGSERRAVANINPRIVGPSHWQERLILGIGVISGQDTLSTQTVSPGEKVTRIIPLHRYYSPLPAGDADIRIDWSEVIFPDAVIRGEPAGVQKTPLACDQWSQSLRVTIQPATHQYWVGVAERLMKILRKPNRSQADVEVVFAHFPLEFKDELFDVVIQMLDSCVDGEFQGELIELVDGLLASEQHRELIIKYLRTPSPRAGAAFFRRATEGKVRYFMEPQSLGKLVAVPNIWVRTLAWVSGTATTQDDLGRDLLRELQHTPPAPDPDRLKQLVDRLDSPSFRSREQADKELLGLGEGSISFLEASLKQSLSAEQRHRVQGLLAQLSFRTRDPLAIAAIRYLATLRSSRARTALQALSQNVSSNWVATEAQAALAASAGQK